MNYAQPRTGIVIDGPKKGMRIVTSQERVVSFPSQRSLAYYRRPVGCLDPRDYDEITYVQKVVHVRSDQFYFWTMDTNMTGEEALILFMRNAVNPETLVI